jgi:hypothetical protein
MTEDNAENLPVYNSWFEDPVVIWRDREAVARNTSTTKHTDLPPIIFLQVAVVVSTGALDLVRWVNNRIDRHMGFGWKLSYRVLVLDGL